VFDHETEDLAASVLQICRARGWHVATADGCTGGLVAAALTAIAGSSDVVDRGFVAYSVDRGFVTYSNESKMELLGVPEATLAAHGAVSPETTLAMAKGAVARAGVDLAASIAGVAGPGGGRAEKPVGLVYVGVATKSGGRTERHIFPGDRTEIRQAAMVLALELLRAEARN
jgi:nicotinamide-nucleotide amidase